MSVLYKNGSVIDVHTHFALPDEPRAVLGRHGLTKNAGNFSGVEAPASAEVNRRQMAQIQPRMTDIAEKLKEMDGMDVDIAVISPPPYLFFYWTPAAVGLELAGLHNNRCAEYCRTSDRFIVMATVPLQDPAVAVEELARAQDALGLRGVAIGSNVAGHRASIMKAWSPSGERRRAGACRS
jgi:aminocarboxymuconate-semialdehyde decarboxylase